MSITSFLSIKEVAEQLGVEYKTVYRLIRRGELAAAKIGGVYRLRPSDIDAYVDQQIALTRQEAWSEQSRDKTAHLRCERCLRLIKDENGIGGLCDRELCENIICTPCWSANGRYCRYHEPTPADKLAAAQAARAAGDISLLVTAVEARRRELNFRDRFDRKIHQLRQIAHPLTGTAVAVNNWSALHTPADESRQVAELLDTLSGERPRLERLPTNPRSHYAFPAGRRHSQWHLEARTLSRLPAFVRHGFDTEPMTAAELLDILQAYVKTAETENAVSVVGLAAVTGWTPEATALIQGNGRDGQAWAHRLVQPILIDLDKQSLHVAPANEQLRPYLPLFALPLPEEEVAAVERYIQDHIEQESSLAASDLQETLGVSAGAILTAFQRLVAGGRYFIEEVEGVGRVIAKL